MRFLHAPIRIPVAAVSWQAAEADALTVPIVKDREVGASYAEYVLGIPRKREIPSPYDPDAFARRLLNAPLVGEDGQRTNPTIFVDELMALQATERVFDELIEGGEVGDRRVQLSSADETVAADMPIYSLGFAVHRRDIEWHDYLSESWDLFVASNTEVISRRYARAVRRAPQPGRGGCRRWAPKLHDNPSWQAEVERFLDAWDHAILRWLRFDRCPGEPDDLKILQRAAAAPGRSAPL